MQRTQLMFLTCLGSVGAICFNLFFSKVALGQSIIADPNWGNEATEVLPIGVNAVEIRGGATRDSNLFHSFLEFDIPEGGSAYFLPSPEVSDIFSRVIGGSPSNIQGILGVTGNANLFLMNPNGVVFGPEASLDVQGSFVTTTATSMRFGAQGQFDTISPQPVGILTVDPSAFLFSQLAPASITNQSIAPNPQNAEFTDGLRVADGHSLLLVGGDIFLPQGQLRAPGGTIKLAGLAEPGEIQLNTEDNLLALAISPEQVRANIFIAENAVIDASASSGGRIDIHANNISMLDGSRICTGVGTNSTCGGAESEYEIPNRITGNIVLDAAGFILVSGEDTEISNLYELGDNITQEIGSIFIVANDALIRDNARISSRRGTPFEIDTGNIEIDADSIFIESDVNIENSVTSRRFESQIQGSDIRINAANLIRVLDSSIETDISGRNQAGDILLRSRHLLVEDADISSTTAFGAGESGDVYLISDESITLVRSEVDVANAFGSAGIAGNIFIRAQDLSLVESLLTGEIDTGGIAGNIDIQIDGVAFLLSSEITSANSNGQFAGGVAGDILLRADSLFLTEESSISASTAGKEDDTAGLAGEINIGVSNVVFLSNSEILSQSRFSDQLGQDRGGQVILEGAALILTDASEISVSTDSAARAGDITIRTGDFIFVEEGSVISNVVAPEAAGAGGNITIQTQRLGLTSGGQINASVLGETDRDTGGEGAGGSIFVTANEFLTISGSSPERPVRRFDDQLSLPGTSSGLYSNSGRGALGPGGQIIVNAGTLSIAEGGVISTQTFNATGGGSVTVNAQDLELVSGGQVLTGTFGEGAAGSVTLTVQDQVSFSGQDAQFFQRLEQYGDNVVVNVSPASGVFANTGEFSSGPGGTIRLQANEADIHSRAAVSAQSLGSGPAGNILIVLTEDLHLQDADITTAAQQSAGGGISVEAQQIILRGDGDIRTNVASGSGGGGNISLSADLILAFDDSDILAFAQVGAGGDITLDTPAFFGQNFQPISGGIDLASLDGNGRVDVDATGQIASGNVSIPDVSFIENSLTALEETVVDTAILTAGSCIVRTDETTGSFVVTGGEGLPQQPGRDTISAYPTGTIRTIPESAAMSVIREPQSVYRLADGRLVLSHECE